LDQGDEPEASGGKPSDKIIPKQEEPMAKVDPVIPTSEGPGFVVRQDDNNLVAAFAFKTEADAQAAHKKMQEILSTCHSVKRLP
jgi:hypothetical protein